MTTHQVDPVRDLHKLVLETATRHAMRAAAAKDPAALAEHATTVAVAWAAHRLLAPLQEADPATTYMFADVLTTELEGGHYGDLITEHAEALGLNPQEWIDEETERREATRNVPTPTITRDVAFDVLWHLERGSTPNGRPTTGFVHRLLVAWNLADESNHARLTAAYPEYGAALDMLRQPHGVERLRAIANP